MFFWLIINRLPGYCTPWKLTNIPLKKLMVGRWFRISFFWDALFSGASTKRHIPNFFWIRCRPPFACGLLSLASCVGGEFCTTLAHLQPFDGSYSVVTKKKGWKVSSQLAICYFSGIYFSMFFLEARQNPKKTYPTPPFGVVRWYLPTVKKISVGFGKNSLACPQGSQSGGEICVLEHFEQWKKRPLPV